MLFIYLCEAILIYRNVYSKYCRRYKKMEIKEPKDFIQENYYRGIQFPEKNSYSMNHNNLDIKSVTIEH